ncbi:MAG: DUF2567 domain-containing protein [Rhodococcus sp. (in: high G+C Gram-positive bacteria)]
MSLDPQNPDPQNPDLLHSTHLGPSAVDADVPSRSKIVGSTLALSILVGVVAAFVWAVLAPGEQFAVVEPGVGAALTGESLHRFDAVAVFVCVTAVAGIVLPLGFWAWTRARGPMLGAGLVIGAFIAAAATLGLGVWVAGLRQPPSDDAVVGAVVSVAPGFETPLVLIVQPLVTALVVVLLAALNPHDDLRFTPGDDVVSDQSEDVPNPPSAAGHYASGV